ncbi:MAG: 2-C-methyl-D-erythritol 2,4-cyclodiphosphate synthase [Flavobacteriales bacterium]|nr:MAG: 2-C-methyl-D-erythritol 2,4-cyclodiphosphate synthase [Flavobacteriales bacterium]
MAMRIGFGFDIHQLKEGEDFWIGGIKIDHSKGAVGHSDADVLIHAICDAMLGAANLRDIGFHFPDSAEEFRGIDSKVLLRKTAQLIEERGYKLGNIDCTVCLQQPKISPYVDKMRKTLADVLETDEINISIKATTSEKLGFVGREEGVSAYAVVLLEN